MEKRENFMRFLNDDKPMWMPHIKEFNMVNPACIPDNWARGMVSVPGMAPADKLGGPDMFGVNWEYQPDDGSSMIRPGGHPVKDLDRWEEYVEIPDVDSWDWEGTARAIEDQLNDGRIIMCSFMNGFFERLISFVGMEEALIAMIDEDSEEPVHRLFEALCPIYDKILCNMKKYYKADVVWFHDDWGSQRAPFFSEDTVRSMILPYLKRVTDSAHKYGIIMNFHSCGLVEELVPVMIDAGVDMWDGQSLNDKEKILRKYGDQIVCNDNPVDLPPEAGREEERKAVADFLSKYRGLKVYVGMHFGEHPLEYSEVYEQSLKLFAE